MHHRAGSMENDYPVTPKSVLIYFFIKTKKSMYRYILVHTGTYFLTHSHTTVRESTGFQMWHSFSISVHCLILSLKPLLGVKKEPTRPVLAHLLRCSILYRIRYRMQYDIVYYIIYDIICRWGRGLTCMASWREIPWGAWPGIGTGNPCSVLSNADLSNEFQSGISDRNRTSRFSDPG